jgi:hypothetical protein
MRQYKGITHTKAHCKVCNRISETVVHTVNGVLDRVHIRCVEHTEYKINVVEFLEVTV